MRPPARAAILVVDDSLDSCELLDDMLRHGGYDVHTARSAEEALVYLGAATRGPAMAIDLVLMDITLPRIDGLTAIRRIRAVDRLRDLPIVVVSGHAEASTLQEAFSAGACDYVTKPVRRAELLARVAAALRRGAEPSGEGIYARALLDLNQRLEEANAALQRLSHLDLLTDVPNRTYLDTVLDAELRRACREKADLSLVMIDVDFLHDYNERLGQPAGDTCLRRVAAALRDTLWRPADFLARFDGGEFAAVLPRTAEAGSRVVAEKLRHAVEELALAHPASPIAPVVTVTAGVATAPVDGGLGVQALLDAAQRGLQLGKSLGRNRVCATLSRGSNRTTMPGTAVRP